MSQRRRRRPSRSQHIVNVAAHPATARLATEIDDWFDNGRGGRPAAFDTRVRLALLVGSDLYQGDATFAQELQDPDHWDLLAGRFRDRIPDIALPDHAPTRDTMRKFRDRIANTPELVRRLRKINVENAVTVARQMGLLQPDAVLDDEIHISQCLVADQTTLRLAADELHEPVNILDGEPAVISTRRRKLKGQDATDGTGRTVHGTTLVTTVMFSGHPGEHLIIDIAVLPRRGDETNPAFVGHRSEGIFWIEVLEHLAELGVDRRHIAAVIHDGAVKGTAIEEIHRGHGIVVLSPVAVTRKSISMPPVRFVNANGSTCTHYLHGHLGELFEIVLGPGDKPQNECLPHNGVRIEGVPGDYTMVGIWDLPCNRSDSPHCVEIATGGPALTIPAGAHKPTQVKSIEHLRPVPATSVIHNRLYKWLRNTVEGRNRRTKQLLQRDDRQRTWGAERLSVDAVITSLDQMVRAQHIHDRRIAAEGPSIAKAPMPQPRQRAIEKAEWNRRQEEKQRRDPKRSAES